MRQHRKQGKSIFQFIFAAMLIVLGIEVALLIGTLYFGNVGMQMNRNACLLYTSPSPRDTR